MRKREPEQAFQLLDDPPMEVVSAAHLMASDGEIPSWEHYQFSHGQMRR